MKKKHTIPEKRAWTLKKILPRLRRTRLPSRKKRVVFVCLTGDQLSWSRETAKLFAQHLKKKGKSHLFNVWSIGAKDAKEFIKRKDIVVSPLFNGVYSRQFSERVNEIKSASRKGTHLGVVLTKQNRINLEATFARIMKKAGVEEKH
jgi:uncharacterized protein YueI